MTGWIDPAWTARGWLLRSAASTIMNEDAVFTNVGPGKADSELKRWFWDDHGGLGVTDVELSRDEKVAVGVAGFNDELLRMYRPLFDPYNAPAQDLTPWGHNTPVVEACFDLTNPAGGKVATPTLSPDARGLAYAAGDGVHVVGVPDIAGACAGAGADRLVLPGATSPDWGGAGAQGGGQQPTALRVTVPRQRLARALRKGLVLTVSGTGAGRVTAIARRGATRVGSGRAVARKGRATVRIRFTAKARRTLAHRPRVALTLEVAAARRTSRTRATLAR